MASDKKQSTDGQYTVVARRYRPQGFDELVGQNHIATALSNAIGQNRVGHAYLFTGARGVGKTSSARIFAKCLNCSMGPTSTPCNECDICDAVSVGEDVDVLEIDGASNRGIDEIRQLRSNAGVRPSRSKYKIYIIDEVHMLTSQAFNALLKTLEEPPEHVKFIFCTTDPQKIPITVLSRCQRFDFSPVQPDEIANKLKTIAENEGVETDDEALALLARRANGSMRDSQSLLEQLFSFCGDKISVNEVHQLLGTADISRVSELATAMANRDASASLGFIATAISDGVDAGQFTEQLLAYFRDMMAARVGCDVDSMISCPAAHMDHLKSLGDQLGLETTLAAVQLLDGAIVKMQYSMHTRTLLEVAVVRICNLQQLDSIGDLISALESGKVPNIVIQGESIGSSNLENKTESPASQTAPKKNEPVVGSPINVTPVAKAIATDPVSANLANDHTDESNSDPATSPTASQAAIPAESIGSSIANLNVSNVRDIWKRCLDRLGDVTADLASDFERLELPEPQKLVVTMGASYNRDMCSRPDRKQKLEAALKQVCGQSVRIDFVVSTTPKKTEQTQKPKLTRAQQIRKLHERPFVKKAIEVFDAEIVDYRAK